MEPQSFNMLNSVKEAASQPNVLDQAQASSSDNTQSIYAHCLDFTEGEQEYFYVGSEDFNIY